MNLNPFARLPKSWTNDSALGWAEIIDLLRDKGENVQVEAVGTFEHNDRISPVDPPVPKTRPAEGATISSAATQAVRDLVGKDHMDLLPPEAIELDLLDSDVIPTLIAGVLRGSNVNEFLERLGVLACTGMRWTLYAINFSSRNVSGKGKAKILEDSQFSSMLRQVYFDERYAELAIRVAYQVFWHSGERQLSCSYI